MAKGSKDSADGCATGVGVAVVGIGMLITAIPKEVWIGLGIVVGIAGLIGLVYWVFSSVEKSNAAAQERALANQAAQAAQTKRQREEAAQKARQRRIEILGKKNAALVESAAAAARKVGASEAARAGWLGDVDFNADIKAITDKFEKAHALGKVAKELSALDQPSVEDRAILAEANATISNLESDANERVELIGKCAIEAGLIDESLKKERADARTAEQRAKLHAKLSAMLYGIEATPDLTSNDSAADAVMARVQAYREIKNQIQRARDAG